MTSLFTAFVARGSDIPEVDPRIESHVDIRGVVPADAWPAVPATEAVVVTPTSTPTKPV